MKLIEKIRELLTKEFLTEKDLRKLEGELAERVLEVVMKYIEQIKIASLLDIGKIEDDPIRITIQRQTTEKILSEILNFLRNPNKVIREDHVKIEMPKKDNKKK